MSSAHIGDIKMFAGNFAPRNWAFCQGQLLSIAQNSALFSILGTTYGGNGQTNFGLPDLRGRVPVGMGQGPGLAPRQLGELAGSENHTLQASEMPNHSHALAANSNAATQRGPGGNFPAASDQRNSLYATTANTTMAATAVGAAGGNTPHNNMQPYLGMNFIICLYGIYPSRN